MCYICEDQGTVGPKYRATLLLIGKALKVWKAKKAQRYSGDKSLCPDIGNPRVNWGISRPKRDKVWTAKDFAAYQKRTRYNALPGTGFQGVNLGALPPQWRKAFPVKYWDNGAMGPTAMERMYR